MAKAAQQPQNRTDPIGFQVSSGDSEMITSGN